MQIKKIMNTDIEQIIIKEFPQDPGLIYLNHAAVSPWPLRTANVIQQFANENVHQGAKNYPAWMEREKILRGQIQQLIHAPDINDIALQKNTSEALSVVASGISWKAGDNIVTSDEEFPSNRIVWQAQEKAGVELRQVNIRDQKNPERALLDQCDTHTRILAISSVQYASGIRLDLARLGEHCRKHGILFCVDAIQSIGAININVEEIQADFVMADGHKWMLGPEGIALFYCREAVRDQLQLHQFGWHMVEHCGDYNRKDWEPAQSARRFECGSPNMLGIFALSASLSLILEAGIETIEQRIQERLDLLFEYFRSKPGIEILTPHEQSQRAGIFTFRNETTDLLQLHQQLMQQQVICAYRGGGIRFSPHFYTAPDKIYKLLDILNVSI